MKVQRIVYLGSMQTPENCIQNPWASEAMNITQLTLMQAFLSCGVQEILGISLPGTSAWLTRPRLRPRKYQVLQSNIEIIELPFISLGPLQPISQLVSVFCNLMCIIGQERPDLILITNPITRLSLPAILLGKLWHKPVVIIVSDLSPPTTASNPLRQLRQKMQYKMVQLASGVVVFSSHVGRKLRQRGSWIRMTRPPASDVMTISQTKLNASTKNIYFAGTTAEVSGTALFLQAIPLIKSSEYRFWFSGRGPLDDRIREAAHHDDRITHWGFVSREKYKELLQEANVLVNPRPTQLPENLYNFPSKLMEYMAAGRPIISTATSDVGEYYQDAIVLLDDETANGLATAIIETCELPFEIQVRLGHQARQHVEHETWELQAQRILDFAESLQR